MPTLKIDGKEVTVEKGRSIIQACEQLGIEVPRYCYHPGLRVVGSCRMCLVDIEKSPKLQIACNTQVADGMVVWTHNEKVQEARRSVLEFLLLNHPLDCPVCDRAGECELQNYYMKYGLYNSRLHENKMKRRKAFPIGPHVILDQERCVLCSRCVRFAEEVAKTKELGIFNKGTWSEVNVYPGRQLENKYSGNVVDICPVGALLDRDFRYEMSVWYLKEQFSVCPSCSNGCNIRINYNMDRRYKVQGRRVMRLKPRFNENVNKWWMCDEGRYNYRWIDVERIEEPTVREEQGRLPIDWKTSISMVANEIKKAVAEHGPTSVGIIASPWMTNEELYLTRKVFVEGLQIPLLHYYIPPPASATEDNFLIKKDKNPNSKGADLILSEHRGFPVEAVLEVAKAGRLKVLYIFHTDLVKHFGMELVRDAFAAVETVIYQGTNENETMKMAKYVLPMAAYAEIEGTFTNYQGRVQRIFPAVPPLWESRPALEILRDLGKELGLEIGSAGAADVFRELASVNSAFAGIDYNTIGLSGRLVSENPTPAIAAD
jgi:NADH-quinone oxidoreductase subunit G